MTHTNGENLVTFTSYSYLFVISFFFSSSLHSALASSEFCILHTPSAVSFRDARAIPSNDVGKVICSALKLPLTDPSEWDGMYITSAFGTPSAVIVLEVEGRGSGSYGDLKTQTYAIDGDDAHQSIAQAGEHVKESRALYVALDLTDGPSTVRF